MSRTLVIGEPGCTHEGDFDTLVSLLETASQCGADVFKPQWVSSAERHLTRRTAKLSAEEAAEFRRKFTRSYGWLEFPLAWHRELRDRAHDLGMQYACSVNLREDVWVLEPFVDAFKVASFEFCDERLIRTVAATGKPYWIGAGMTTTIDRHNGAFSRRRLMFCTSAYPTPESEASLSTISSERLRGYSDHTRNELAGVVAVSQGATVVEAHYRLDDCDPGNPDYVVAFTPSEFKRYVVNIRTAERLLGTPRILMAPSEEPMAIYRVNE